MIKYIAQNSSYDSAFMDYEKDEFNYGDWADAWFIKGIKPVILNPDGTVDVELNSNNYSLFANESKGAAIDNASIGNVMVGIPTVWVRYAKINNKDTFYFSNVKLSDDFNTFAHTDANGNIMPYTYMAAYNGYMDENGKMRSLSGKFPTRSMSGTDQISGARANNPTGKNMWDIDILADRQLINLLLLLIGKSTDSQAVFGNGNMNGLLNNPEESDTNGILKNGSMNDKGLFWGSNKDNLGVKVFGIENFWGNTWKRTQGLILSEGTLFCKLTRGTEDGSTATDYNGTGEGYIHVGIGIGSSGGYIRTMKGTKYGLFPSAFGGTDTTYYCDYLDATTVGKRFALFGGFSNNGSKCGAFACRLATLVSGLAWEYGANISCKPY